MRPADLDSIFDRRPFVTQREPCVSIEFGRSGPRLN
jgi:hypothetical protein